MPDDPNMGAAPHVPMTDEEIERRFVQLREQVTKEEGRLFMAPEMNFIGDLMEECRHRQRRLDESEPMEFRARLDLLEQEQVRLKREQESWHRTMSPHFPDSTTRNIYERLEAVEMEVFRADEERKLHSRIAELEARLCEIEERPVCCDREGDLR